MTSPEDLFRIGLALMKQNQHQQAEELAAVAVLDHPDDGNLWELLGVAQHHERRHEAACEALETATLLKPLDVGARFCLAGSYAATGCRELAIFVYRMVAHDEQTPNWLLPRVAARLGQMEEYTDALETCQALLLRDPARHEAHFGVAFYLSRLGAPLDCVTEAITRAHEAAPEISLYRVVLASLLHEQGQTEDAYDLLRHLAPDAIRCPHSLRRMSLVFCAACDPERAQECLDRMRHLERHRSPKEGTH
jgi:tetratricopeptide (TPR) repeat protein